MSTVEYTLNEKALKMRDVAKIRRAGMSGDLDQIIDLLNKLIIISDGTLYEDLDYKTGTRIAQEVFALTNGVEVPNSSGS